MPNNKARTRVQVNPLYSESSFPLGSKFEKRVNANANWIPDSQNVGICVPTLSAKFTDAKFCKDYLHKPPFHEGGPFLMMRITPCRPSVTGVHGNGVYISQNNLKRYSGGFSAPKESDWLSGVSMTTPDAYLVENSSHFPSTEGLGEEAWNRSKPKLEKAGGAVFLAELRDLPRMLKTSARTFHDAWKTVQHVRNAPMMAPKPAADHFLNFQFGWKPFIKDLSKFHDAYRDSEKLIDRLSRENGQWVKRRFPLASETTRTKIASADGFKLYPLGVFTVANNWFTSSSNARWEVWEEIDTSTWVSGKWRYYRPEFDRTRPDYSSVMSRAGRQLTLYGVRISPTNVYRATPWTWAADWFSNVGDHVEHVNDMLIDSIANKYLYAMKHTVRRRVFIQHAPFRNVTLSLRFERVIETKQRVEGLSPYGFSLHGSDLSPRQLAIIAALGLSSKKNWVQ